MVAETRRILSLLSRQVLQDLSKLAGARALVFKSVPDHHGIKRLEGPPIKALLFY